MLIDAIKYSLHSAILFLSATTTTNTTTITLAAILWIKNFLASFIPFYFTSKMSSKSSSLASFEAFAVVIASILHPELISEDMVSV